jgi:hypothetical protein
VRTTDFLTAAALLFGPTFVVAVTVFRAGVLAATARLFFAVGLVDRAVFFAVLVFALVVDFFVAMT